MIVDCRLVDDLPPALVAEPATLRLTAFPRVPASLRYRVEPKERGDWETGWLYVRYRSPLGLAERWARAPLTQTVRVYPALRAGEEQQIFLARSRQIDLQLRRSQLRGLGRDFESLRDYREGDDLRDICWTATARRGTPITRQYQTERSQPVWIVLDCGRLMRARVAMARSPKNSGAARQAIPSSTTPARRLWRWRNWRFTPVTAWACWLMGKAFSSGFCPVAARPTCGSLSSRWPSCAPKPSEADHLRATATLNRLQPRRSLILWVTDLAETAMRPEVIDGALQLLRRHVLLFVAMAQPEVEPLRRRGPGMSSRCSAPPQRRRWPAAANCFWPGCMSRAR